MGRPREILGCLVRDLPVWLPALALPGRWVLARNRGDRFTRRDGGVDITASGPFSADLHVCRVFPGAARRLLRQALAQWPFGAAEAGAGTGAAAVSVILPHRGREREPLLRATVGSFLSQRDVAVECLVVEQSRTRELADLPDGVRHLHLPHAGERDGFRRSWAFNAGALAASSPILVCHDGDMPVPRDYGREVLARFRDEAVDVLHLQRFLFCLGRADTERLLADGTLPDRAIPERVRQNWKGGTLAIRRARFFELGGFDESFVGWGGEDREFFERCGLLRSWRWGYLPFVHLWHAAQATAAGAARAENLAFTDRVLAVPPEERIRRLRERRTLGGGMDVAGYVRISQAWVR